MFPGVPGNTDLPSASTDQFAFSRPSHQWNHAERSLCYSVRSRLQSRMAACPLACRWVFSVKTPSTRGYSSVLDSLLQSCQADSWEQKGQVSRSAYFNFLRNRCSVFPRRWDPHFARSPTRGPALPHPPQHCVRSERLRPVTNSTAFRSLALVADAVVHLSCACLQFPHLLW